MTRLYAGFSARSGQYVNDARDVAFIVPGADNAEMLSRVLEGPYEPIVLPSQVIKPASDGLSWLLDARAAALLRRPA